VDCVVATPGRLLAHLKRGALSLEHCVGLVLDEVDVLAGARVARRAHASSS
jgi:superfamily II DNA/RNA helicase